MIVKIFQLFYFVAELIIPLNKIFIFQVDLFDNLPRNSALLLIEPVYCIEYIFNSLCNCVQSCLLTTVRFPLCY